MASDRNNLQPGIDMEELLKQLKLRKPSCAFLIPGIAVSYYPAVVFLKDSMVFRNRARTAGLAGLVETILGSAADDADLWDDDNLGLQKLSYVVNTTVSDQCLESGLIPSVIVGYSMGIYAALYAAGFYSFETGLEIVERAYYLVRGHCRSQCREYGMGLLLGFTEEEIQSLLLPATGGQVMIAMRNGIRSFILAGEKESLKACLADAHGKGALGVRELAAKHPYHTGLLQGMEQDFVTYLNTIPYLEPHTPVPSLVTGRVIDRSIVAEEIARAMCCPLALDAVVTSLAERFGIEYGVDIGPKQSMKKLVRYIDDSLLVEHYPEALQS